MQRILVLALLFLSRAHGLLYQGADFVTLGKFYVVNETQAHHHETSCLQNKSACVFTFIFPTKTFNFVSQTYRARLHLTRQLCSTRFTNRDVNTDLAQETFFVQNNVWQFIMQVGECIIINRGTARIVQDVVPQPSVQNIGWFNAKPSITQTTIFDGFRLAFNFSSTKQQEYIVHAPCEIIFAAGKKITPFRYSKTFQCAYYIWATECFYGHSLYGQWTDSIEKKITVLYRDSDNIKLITAYPLVEDYYYEMFHTLPPDNSDFGALQFTPASFFSKVNIPLKKEDGLYIYTLKVLAIKEGPRLWKQKKNTNPSFDKSNSVLFMYGNTAVKNITLFVDAKQGTPIYIRRWLLSQYGYPNVWVA